MNISSLKLQTVAATGIVAFALVFSVAIFQAEAALNDSSISLKKDPNSGLFTLTIRDPDGVQEFSLSPVGRSRYGGGLSGCDRSFSSTNVAFMDPGDFTPVMPAYVIDCDNNTTQLQIPPPVRGVTRSAVMKKEVLPPPPPPPPAPAPRKEEDEEEGTLSKQDIRYPVSELGACKNETECRSYCDNSQHAKACMAFAKKYHLISEKEAQEATDKFLNVTNGPGGCNSWSSCEAYCNSVDHLDECIAFADTTGHYSAVELAEAKKFQALVKAGKQFPGGCRDRNTCELYCSVADHMEECLVFAEESGVMPKEEIVEARKFMTLMRRGESPGGCTSKEQCEKYCFEEGHSEECIAFAEKAGVMSAEDAAMARKTGGKGPGNCRSKQQCDAYCESHSEECFHFAQEHGLIGEDDLKRMREGMAHFREELDRMPPEAVQCMKDAAGEENFNKMLAGEPVFDRSLESKMKSCFSKMTSQVSQQLNSLPPEAAQCIKSVVGEDGLAKLQSGELGENVNFSDLEVCFRQMQESFGGGPDDHGGPGGFVGPGGCTSIDECSAYCQSNPEECENFSPPGGGSGGGARRPDGQGFPGGPGGCRGPEECMSYCKNHPEECKDFSPPAGRNSRSGMQGKGEQHDGFSECGITDGAVAEYVCGVGGSSRGALTGQGTETTYFNECHAREQGAEVLHKGVCIRNENQDVPCSNIAHPVCGTDGNSWTHECHAKEAGASVKHEGVCTDEDRGRNAAGRPSEVSGGGARRPDGQGFPGGPGGCETHEECRAYCESHPQECGGAVPVRENTEAQQFQEQYQQQFQQQFQQQYQDEYREQYQQSRPTENYGSPGGCKTTEECRAYCVQNYQDPGCQQFMPPSSMAPRSLLSGTALASSLGKLLGPWLELLH